MTANIVTGFRGIAFYTAIDIYFSPAKVYGNSGMYSGDFCGLSGGAHYLERKKRIRLCNAEGMMRILRGISARIFKAV